MAEISGDLSRIRNISGSLSGTRSMSGTVRLPEHVGTAYTGPYEVTPGPERIVLETDGTFASDNIVINPIPSNYGRITWNGTVLTVS